MKNKQLIYLWLPMMVFSLNTPGYAQKINENNKILTKRWFEHLSKRDQVAPAGMYVDSAFVEFPNSDGAKRGPAAIRKIYSRYFTTFPDLCHHMTSRYVNDNGTVIECTFSGTMVDPEKNLPNCLQGGKYALNACSRMKIQQEKITALYHYIDQAPF